MFPASVSSSISSSSDPSSTLAATIVAGSGPNSNGQRADFNYDGDDESVAAALNEFVAACSADSSFAASKQSVHISGFDHLYCGLINLIQSYLPMEEILRLARVSHYYRKVSMGLVNPQGSCRIGKDLPLISWETLTPANSSTKLRWQQDKCQHIFNEPDSLCENCGFINRVPRFLPHANRILEEFARHLPPQDSELSKEIEAAIATKPARTYGMPAEGRQCTFTRHSGTLYPLDVLLFSPIVGRYMQSLEMDCFSTSELTLISLRFPHLHSLKVSKLDYTREKFLIHPLVSAEIRFPPQLRSLSITGTEYSPKMITALLPLLPQFCPLLQELNITVNIPADCSLAPLLALSHLTHLSISLQIHIMNPAVQGSFIQQLKNLNYLGISVNTRFDLKLYLPISCMTLEYFRLPFYCTESDLLSLAECAPQLRSFEVMRPSRTNEWQIVDHSSLITFRSLHTLRYGQKLYDIGYHGNVQLSWLGQRCVEVHGSIEKHVDHVISVFSQMSSLTDLKLEELYTPPPSRGVRFNSQFLESHQLQDIQPFEPPVTASQESTIGATASSNVHPHSLLRHHSVFKLTAVLPQLLKLSISHLSGVQLPSLSFLSNLPHLQALSISRADYLPIESLYDLQHVSTTLTSLSLLDCFPLDSKGRSVFLLHDVLQPLQLSYPVTAAATIQFPKCMRNAGGSSSNSNCVQESASSSNQAAQNETKVVPILVFNASVAPTDPVAACSDFLSPETLALKSVSFIPPRHSSWYEVFTEISGNISPLLIFDSFTAHAPKPLRGKDGAAEPCLTSHLLPQLKECRIQHCEPNNRRCVFSYDRLQIPRYGLGEKKITNVNLSRNYLVEDRNRMRTRFGIRLDDSIIQEIDGSEYHRMLNNYEPFFKSVLA